MSRRLLISTNPWPFIVAVERQLALDLSPHGPLDLLDVTRVLGEGVGMGWRDHLYEKFNRKLQRFVLPHLSGRDISADFRVGPTPVPPLPEKLSELRSYQLEGCRLGISALSTAANFAQTWSLEDARVYGQLLQQSWHLAHRTHALARQLRGLGYSDVYLFNGRHCTSRPFCEVLQGESRLWRYECNDMHENYPREWSYFLSDDSLHSGPGLRKLVDNHIFQPTKGDAYFQDRAERRPTSGSFHFLREQQIGNLPEVAGQGNLVTLFSSSPDEFFALADTYAFGEFSTQGEVAIALAEICRILGKRFLIRLHPHLRFKPESWREEWDFAELEQQGAFVIGPAEACDSYALAKASECVVTCGSTIGVEAAYFGTPSLAVGSGYYSEIGAAQQATTRQQLEDFVRTPRLQEESRERAQRLGSFNYTGGTLLKDFRQPAGPESARIDGRLADPVRTFIFRVKDWWARLRRRPVPN
jgi:hypothetical protein